MSPQTGVTKIPIVFSAEHQHHDPPFELNAGQRVSPVYERPARLDAIIESIGSGRLQPAVPQDDAALLAVHDPAMVEFLRTGYDAWRAANGPEVMIPDTFRSPRWASGGQATTSPIGRAGWWCTDTATPVVAGTFQAARAAVDVALTGAHLLDGGAQAAYGLTRPPGHHAGYDYYGGFCFFNHVAVAAKHLGEHGRVAILDVDVHHGNGTQDLFWRDPQVMYASLHAHPDHEFPFFSGFADEVGEGAGRGTNRNTPLLPGTADADYLRELEAACDAIVEFEPAVVVVSLGFDASVHDPIGPLSLTQAGFAAIGQNIAALGLPTLLLQEGGYAIDHLGDLALAVLDAFDHPAGQPVSQPTD